MSDDKVQVTAIPVDDDFDPEAVDRSFDPNSGAAPQPGGIPTLLGETAAALLAETAGDDEPEEETTGDEPEDDDSDDVSNAGDEANPNAGEPEVPAEPEPEPEPVVEPEPEPETPVADA